MRTEDLDEFEGLTADMVREWLRAKGWERAPEEDVRKQECWRLNGGANGSLWITERFLGTAVEQISRWSGLPIQSLLREINPRMRPGWPTEEELERHPLWLVSVTGSVSLADEGTLHIRSAEKMRGLARLSAGTAVACWPCDAHGNKVRRGTVG